MRHLGSVGFGLLLLLAVTESLYAKNCSIPFFPFNITSEGPWAAYMTVQAGKSCGGRRWSFAGSANGLFLKATPRHGKVVLTFPGTYRYFPTAGYVGDDAFTLRLCGTSFEGRDGCADLLFSVKVVNSSV